MNLLINYKNREYIYKEGRYGVMGLMVTFLGFTSAAVLSIASPMLIAGSATFTAPNSKVHDVALGQILSARDALTIHQQDDPPVNDGPEGGSEGAGTHYIL